MTSRKLGSTHRRDGHLWRLDTYFNQHFLRSSLI